MREREHKGLALLSVFFAVSMFLMLTVVPCISATSSNSGIVTKVKGLVSLGNTKAQVIKALGKPSSPQKFDFYYNIGDNEVIIAFDDKTKLVQSIIVRGNSGKYTVNGIALGDSKLKVESVFGKAERKIVYKNNNTECWHFNSKNVYFCINDKNKVVSFSVSNCCPVK